MSLEPGKRKCPNCETGVGWIYRIRMGLITDTNLHPDGHAIYLCGGCHHRWEELIESSKEPITNHDFIPTTKSEFIDTMNNHPHPTNRLLAKLISFGIDSDKP